MKRQCRALFFLLISPFVLLSCSKQDVAPKDSLSNSTAVVLHVKPNYFAPGQLETHYQKHAAEFGVISQQEYLQQAQMLLNSPVTGDVLEKTRLNGDVLRYRRSTGEFAVMTATGRIRTYFKTDWQYWMKQ